MTKAMLTTKCHQRESNCTRENTGAVNMRTASPWVIVPVLQVTSRTESFPSVGDQKRVASSVVSGFEFSSSRRTPWTRRLSAPWCVRRFLSRPAAWTRRKSAWCVNFLYDLDNVNSGGACGLRMQSQSTAALMHSCHHQNVDCAETSVDVFKTVLSGRFDDNSSVATKHSAQNRYVHGSEENVFVGSYRVEQRISLQHSVGGPRCARVSLGTTRCLLFRTSGQAAPGLTCSWIQKPTIRVEWFSSARDQSH